LFLRVNLLSLIEVAIIQIVSLFHGGTMLKVKDVMTTELITVSPETEIL
jgi:hypothetical protein